MLIFYSQRIMAILSYTPFVTKMKSYNLADRPAAELTHIAAAAEGLSLTGMGT